MSKITDTKSALRESLALAVRLDEVALTEREAKLAAHTVHSIKATIDESESKFRLPAGSLLPALEITLGVGGDDVISLLQRDRRQAFDRANWGKIALEAAQQSQRDRFGEVDTEGDLFALCSPAWPWLRWARNQLEAAVAKRFGAVAPRGFAPHDATKLFYPALLMECQEIMLRTIALEVNVARVRGELIGESGEKRFSYFCRNLTKPDRALVFWCEYPVLARFVVEACIRWVTRCVELLERLDRDWDSLVEMDLVSRGSPQLVKVLPVGDPHCSGRRVSILNFDKGPSLVYKGRPVAAEKLFGVWLTWLNDRGLDLPLEGPQLCDCGEYGWAQFIDYVGSSEPSSRSEFYFRSGAVLALADALGIRDLSQDNIIARRETPYFVDVECVLSPPVRGLNLEISWSQSVLGIGLLPGLESREGIDQGGLVPSDDATLPSPLPTVTGWRTDRMCIELLPAKLPQTANNTPGKIRPYDLSRYADDLARGFSSAYKLIAADGRSLLKTVSDLAEKSARIRYIPRTTVAYAAVRDGLMHPNILRDAYEGETLIGKLAVSSNRTLLPLLPSERKQLWCLDIPVFWTRADSRDLWTTEDKRIPEIFSLSGLSHARHQIRIGRKREYIDYCSRAMRATMLNSKPNDSFSNFPKATGDIATDCLRLAHEIGQHILGKAWTGDNGKLQWIDRAENVTSRIPGRQTVRPLTDELYSGLGGILMFYIYLFAMTSEPLFGNVVDNLSAQIEMSVRTRCRRALDGRWGDRIQRAGGFTGITSATYALLHASHLRGKSTIVRTARLVIEALSQWPAQETTLDWVGGDAGVISLLLSMDRLLPGVGALELAGACGQRLLSRAQKVGDGSGWVTIEKTPLTGLGHGASGIALALHRLWRVTGDPTLLAAVEGALRFERDHYSTELCNWLDLRGWTPGARTVGALGWCAGAPGIGLARLGMCDSGSLAYSDEITAAFKTTEVHIRELDSDCLCHGRFGNLEFLFAVAWQYGNTSQHEIAIECLGDALETCRRAGFRFSCGGETLNFMLGLAGIGYALLRFASGGAVPSVLSLDLPQILQPSTSLQLNQQTPCSFVPTAKRDSGMEDRSQQVRSRVARARRSAE